MDITSLRNVTSDVIRRAVDTTPIALGNEEIEDTGAFDGILTKAIENLSMTNGYLSDAENEKMRWALGETDNSHDMTIALQKASTALQYTVAVRNKFLEAYKEIMQMQM